MKKLHRITEYSSILEKYRMLLMVNFMVILLLFSLLQTKAGEGDSYGNTRTETKINDETLIKSVAPFPYQWFSAEPRNERTRRLMNKYLLSILDWGDILLKEFKIVPGNDDMGYYGDGRNVEDAVRPICYATFVNAFLSKIKIHAANVNISEERRIRTEEDAIKALRYLTYSHVTGEGTCVGGAKWGNQWQSSLWARAAAMAGWILWDRLDRDMRVSVAKLLEFEANRFIGTEPKSNLISDTGAEENAWNTHCTSLAFNMMPTHPNRILWDKAAKKYMYNTFSVAADHEDISMGDDGKKINEWVTTINAYPDFTLENHGRVHVGYLKLSLCLLLENILNYKLMGNDIPDAIFHHSTEVFGILKKSMLKNTAVVTWGANDWRVVQSQASDNLPYTVDNLLNNDKSSTFIEDAALDFIRLKQYKNNGYYNYRRDLEWSGMAATRIINSFLLHAIFDMGNDDNSEFSNEEYDELHNNVTYLPGAKTIIHRTSTKFASFSWGSYLTALSLNNNESWQIWPRESSYIGLVNGNEADRKNIIIEDINHKLFKNGFEVTGKLRRNIDKLNLIQDVTFTSLDNDITVYIERITKISGEITSRETGIIGHEFEINLPERVLYHNDGISVVTRKGDQSFNIQSNWLNIGGKIGYVVCRNGQDNLMTYHSAYEKWRNCDYINLIGESNSGWTSDWACVVTFLNQDQEQTASWAKKVVFNINGDSATCKIGNEEVTVTFNDIK